MIPHRPPEKQPFREMCLRLERMFMTLQFVKRRDSQSKRLFRRISFSGTPDGVEGAGAIRTGNDMHNLKKRVRKRDMSVAIPSAEKGGI
jgi:hypothetical protein